MTRRAPNRGGPGVVFLLVALFGLPAGAAGSVDLAGSSATRSPVVVSAEPGSDLLEPGPAGGAVVPAPSPLSAGCLITGESDSMSESSLAVLATLLGFVLFLLVCRRRRGTPRDHRASDASEP